MKEDILRNIEYPGELEKLYRNNQRVFEREFNTLYPEIQNYPTAKVWYERLNYEKTEISWGSNSDLFLIVVFSLLAGFIAKSPAFTGIDTDFFYSRNTAFIIMPFLILYFALKQKLKMKKVSIMTIVLIASFLYINLLPDNNSDTLMLATIHVPLFLMALLGFTFVGDRFNDHEKRLDFLRFIGDLVVITSVILIAGILLTAITVLLFELIKIDINIFYFEYIVVWGLSASPIIGTYLVQRNPHLVNKVSPVIARVFTPLVLLTLIVYLAAILYTGNDPYQDRYFLLIFNLLLTGVLAIIFFSISGTSQDPYNQTGMAMLLSLSVLTIILNSVALSAILFRISEWGITPNRLAVLGGNILILTNLLLVSYRMFRSLKDYREVANVERAITSFLPIYALWAILVAFIFPVLFGFR